MKLYTTLLLFLYGSVLLAQKNNPFFSKTKLFIHEGKFTSQAFLFNTDGTFYFAKVSVGPYRRSYGCYKRKKDRIFLTSSLNKKVLDFVVDKKVAATQDSFHVLSAFDSTFRLNYCHSILINGEDTLTYNIFQNKWTPLKKKKIKYFQLISNTIGAISRRYKPSKKASNHLYTIAVFWENFNSYVEFDNTELVYTNSKLNLENLEFENIDSSKKNIEQYLRQFLEDVTTNSRAKILYEKKCKAKN